MSRSAVATALVAVWPAFGATLEVVVHDAAGKPVADAAVYAVPQSPGPDNRRRRTAQVEQLDREFVPYVSVVQVGTTVSFPNRDPLLHHVYSFSPAKSFEIKLYAGNSPEIAFDKPGVVTLGCNIHDWMIGYILVVPTPHFAKTGVDGLARLSELPEGRYTVNVWHPQQKAAVAPRPVTVQPGVVRVEVAVDAAARKRKFKPPLDRTKY